MVERTPDKKGEVLAVGEGMKNMMRVRIVVQGENPVFPYEIARGKKTPYPFRK